MVRVRVSLALEVVPPQHRTFLASIRSLSKTARERAFSGAVPREGLGLTLHLFPWAREVVQRTEKHS